MDFRCYIAMTATEFSSAAELPKYPAWMACHYASYGTGLSNTPKNIPSDTMLIMNDRVPPFSHDPEYIKEQLYALVEENNIPAVLLDFQQPDQPTNSALANLLSKHLPCPVAVSELYADDTDAAVFINCPPPHTPLSAHIRKWKSREIWLEIAQECETINISHNGAYIKSTTMRKIPEPVFQDNTIHTNYHCEVFSDHILLTLQRTQEQLSEILTQAQAAGICCAVGLHQQLKGHFPCRIL